MGRGLREPQEDVQRVSPWEELLCLDPEMNEVLMVSLSGCI